MKAFRLARVNHSGSRQLQRRVDDLWIHYCYVTGPAQALEVVAEMDPDLLDTARADLADMEVLDARQDPSLDAPIRRDLAARK